MTAITTHREAAAGLNAAQREAVEHRDGPILVLAGAGSGKTRVLTTRIARLIELHGVAPEQILALTFTNKAAGEMRSRIARLLGREPTGMWAGTFHAIGARLLRREAAAVGRSSAFTIYDEDDSLAAMRRTMESLGISSKEWNPRLLRSAISDAKNALVGAAEYASLALDPLSRAAARVYGPYDAALRASNAMDFDDLLVLPVRLFESAPHLLAAYQRRFRFILVDEYQDTNRAQYRLVRLLAGEVGNVCVVGDDDQAIYGWRGADIRNILDFTTDFPRARVVRLEENYRSAPPILALANAVISGNSGRMGKTLRATRGGAERPVLIACLDERDEAATIADEILSRRAVQRDLLLRDVAVLYRTNAQSRPLEDALRARGIPYRIIGAVRFYDRREIRDLLAYLRLVANPADDEAFRRAIAYPRRGLGEATLEMLAAAAREAGVPLLAAAETPELISALRPASRAALTEFAALLGRVRARASDTAVDELLRELLEETRFADALRAEGPEGAERLENVRALLAGAAEVAEDEGGELGLTPLEHFLQRVALVAQMDAHDPDADAVTLMTLHNAKGLEFPLVVISGLEEGLFPIARSRDEPSLLEEERRLLYVGITRAERTLYLSHARSRRRNGETLPSLPSSLLDSIPPPLLEARASLRLRATGRAILPASAEQRRRGRPVVRLAATDPDVEASQDAPRLVKGERVRHARFGAGTVAELSGLGRDTKVTIDFDDPDIGRKRLMVLHAALSREVE